MPQRLTKQEKSLLAYTLLGEAGGEGSDGMAVVAHVIKNRMESSRFPSTVGQVVLAHDDSGYYAFSAWNPPSRGGNNPTGRYSPQSPAYRTALEVIDSVFSGASPDPTNGGMFYYAPSGMVGGKEPYWWSSEAKYGSVTIGGHVFAKGNATPAKAPYPETRYLNARRETTLPRIAGAPSGIEWFIEQPLPERAPRPAPAREGSPLEERKLTAAGIAELAKKGWYDPQDPTYQRLQELGMTPPPWVQAPIQVTNPEPAPRRAPMPAPGPSRYFATAVGDIYVQGNTGGYTKVGRVQSSLTPSERYDAANANAKAVAKANSKYANTRFYNPDTNRWE